MKSLVVYSSKSGNTKRVAEAVARGLGEDTVLATPADAPDYRDFDFVAVGFWIEKERPNFEVQKYLRRLKGKKVGVFFTLGADPASDHARICLENVKPFFEENEVLGYFMCQGKIDPARVKWVRQMPPSEMLSTEHPAHWDRRRCIPTRMIWHAPPKPSAQWPPRSIEIRPGVTKAGGPRNRFAAFRRCREAVFTGYSPACGRKRACFYLCEALKNDGIRRSRRLAYPHPCFPAGHRGPGGSWRMPPPSPAVQQADPEESEFSICGGARSPGPEC